MNNSESIILDEAIEKLLIFVDEKNKTCSVSESARLESRPYLETWVINRLTTLRDSLKSESRTSSGKVRAHLMADYIKP